MGVTLAVLKALGTLPDVMGLFTLEVIKGRKSGKMRWSAASWKAQDSALGSSIAREENLLDLFCRKK